MFKELYHKINPYALDYPICHEKYSDKEEEAAIQRAKLEGRRLDKASSQAKKLMNASTAGGPPFLPTQDKYRPCDGKHVKRYLNRPDVQEALHVNRKVTKWHECSNDIDYNDDDFEKSLVDLYRELIEKAKQHGIEIFIFSGDDDSVCSTAGTQDWIWDLGVSAMADNLWKSWKVDDQTAGYVTKFEMGGSNATFTFATVHGAGHEVPAYRPMEALKMFRNVLSGKW